MHILKKNKKPQKELILSLQKSGDMACLAYRLVSCSSYSKGLPIHYIYMDTPTH